MRLKMIGDDGIRSEVKDSLRCRDNMNLVMV